MLPSYIIALLVVASILLLSGFAYYFLVHKKKTAAGGSTGVSVGGGTTGGSTGGVSVGGGGTTGGSTGGSTSGGSVGGGGTTGGSTGVSVGGGGTTGGSTGVSVGGGGTTGGSTDPECNIQQTINWGRVRCPPGFTTNYDSRMTGEAACFSPGIPCNRCIGPEYPRSWLQEDPGLQWKDHVILAGTNSLFASPVATGNTVMKYNSTGLYVIEPKPLATTPGQKCFGYK